MNRPRMLNGVDLDALRRTIDAARSDTAEGLSRFALTTTWEAGARFRSRREVPSGTPPSVADVHPLEDLLHAASGCLVTTLVHHAANLGLVLRSLTARAVGDFDIRASLGLAPGARTRTKQIRIDVALRVEGGPEVARHLVQVARARSPVLGMLDADVRVELVEAPASTTTSSSTVPLEGALPGGAQGDLPAEGGIERLDEGVPVARQAPREGDPVARVVRAEDRVVGRGLGDEHPEFP